MKPIPQKNYSNPLADFDTKYKSSRVTRRGIRVTESMKILIEVGDRLQSGDVTAVPCY